MIDTLFTFSNKRGQSFSINDHTNPNKVIALQSYPESSTEFKNNEVVPQGQHGVWSFYSYYGSKVTTFSGVIVAETHQEIVQLEETMKTVLGLPIQPTNTDDGFVSVSYTLNGEEVSFEGKLFSSIRFNRPIARRLLLNFSFTLKSSNPFIVGEQNTASGIIGRYKTTFSLPFRVPFSLGKIPINALEITNNGTTFAQTVITFRKTNDNDFNLTNPTITNLTTGKSMTIQTAISSPSKSLVLDSESGLVLDSEKNNVSGLISDDSEFVLLQAGLNRLLFTVDETYDGNTYPQQGAFDIDFKNTYI